MRGYAFERREWVSVGIGGREKNQIHLLPVLDFLLEVRRSWDGMILGVGPLHAEALRRQVELVDGVVYHSLRRRRWSREAIVESGVFSPGKRYLSNADDRLVL